MANCLPIVCQMLTTLTANLDVNRCSTQIPLHVNDVSVIDVQNAEWTAVVSVFLWLYLLIPHSQRNTSNLITSPESARTSQSGIACLFQSTPRLLPLGSGPSYLDEVAIENQILWHPSMWSLQVEVRVTFFRDLLLEILAMMRVPIAVRRRKVARW